MIVYNTKQYLFYALMIFLISFIATIILFQQVSFDDEKRNTFKPVSNQMMKPFQMIAVKVKPTVKKKERKVPIKVIKKTHNKMKANGKTKSLSVSKTNALKTGKKIQSQSNVPRLIGEFKLPVKDFFKQAEKKGAKLVVYDRGKSKLVGQIINHQWSNQVNTRGMSARTRQITKDLSQSIKKQYNQLVQKHYGTGIMEYLIMLPMDLDAQFWGVLSEILKHKKIDLLHLDVIDFTYFKSKNQVHLLVNQVQKKGKKFTINLSAQFL